MTKNYNSSADLLIVAASQWHASAALAAEGKETAAEELASKAAETALRAFSDASFDELALALNHFNRGEDAAWDEDPRFSPDDMEDTTDSPNDGEQEQDVKDQLAGFGEKAGPEHDAVESDDEEDEGDEPSPDIMEGDGLDAEAQRDMQSEQNSPGQGDRGGKRRSDGPRHEDEDENDASEAADDLTEEMDNEVGDDEGDSPPGTRGGGGFARGWRLTDEPGKGGSNYAASDEEVETAAKASADILGGLMESAARRGAKKVTTSERSARLRRIAESRR